jgi:hypothetical protein
MKDTGSGIRDGALQKYIGLGTYHGKKSATKKKNSRVSPCFSHLKFSKRAFLGDMKQW